MSTPRVLITGATGRLGTLVVDELLTFLPSSEIATLVRDERGDNRSKAARLRAKGIETLSADYDDPASLEVAMAGIERLLLISSSDLGVRVRQHSNAIEAAKKSGVSLIAYTSVLHADRSTLSVAEDHRSTEAMLAASGVPFVLLRNSWYTENLMSSIPAALANGELPGAARDGRISSAERIDFAAAAAAVMASQTDQGGRVYELAGDTAYTLAELAWEVSRKSGRHVDYKNLTEGDYMKALVAAGLQTGLAQLLSSSHAAVADGALFDDSRDLSRLIGRPTIAMAASVGNALRVIGGDGATTSANLGGVLEIFHP